MCWRQPAGITDAALRRCEEDQQKSRAALELCQEQLRCSQADARRWQEACRACSAERDAERASWSEDLKRCTEELERCKAELRTLRGEVQARAQPSEQRPCPPVSSSGTSASHEEGGGAAAAAAAAARRLPQEPLISDFFPPGSPAEVRLGELQALYEAHEIDGCVYQFSELAPGQSLQQHVAQQVQSGACPGPFVKETLMFISTRGLRDGNFSDAEQARELLSAWWGGGGVRVNDNKSTGPYRYSSTPIIPTTEWQTYLKNVLCANWGRYLNRTFYLGTPAKDLPTRKLCTINSPVVIVDDEGRRFWGMVRQVLPTLAYTPTFQHNWALRDLWLGQVTPACVTVVSQASSEMLLQNRVSMAMLGSHSALNKDTGGASKRDAELGTGAPATREHGHSRSRLQQQLPLPQLGEAAPLSAMSDPSFGVDAERRKLLGAAAAPPGFGSLSSCTQPAQHSTSGAGADLAIELQMQAASGSQQESTDSSRSACQAGASYAPAPSAAAASAAAPVPGAPVKFLELLFEGCKEKLEELRSKVHGKVFCARVEIVHPLLRTMMGLKEGEVAFHDLQIIVSYDPIILEPVYIITQTNVTDEVLAQQALQRAHTELADAKTRTDELLRRQYELIECLGKVDGIGRSLGGNREAEKLIQGVLQKVAASASDGGTAVLQGHEVKLLEMLGEGSYGKVYKGLWRGTVVAVKSMVLPTNMQGAKKRERMAVLEAAISSKLSHPNIVQTYTYTLKPVYEASQPASSSRSNSGNKEQLPEQQQPQQPEQQQQQEAPEAKRGSQDAARALTAFEVQLLQEFCDCGSLHEALRSGAFITGSGDVNYRAVLETAADIAKGMLHLHALNILHSDLKAHNVLLKSSACEERCVTAKVADFGLSVQMDSRATHVSKMWHGTPTHMAPEVLLEGHQSKAADVYAFGITLWELLTGRSPFENIPNALWGHKVIKEGLRPIFPHGTAPGYVALAQRCWAGSAASRPTFEEILDALRALRKAEGGSTECMEVTVRLTRSLNESGDTWSGDAAGSYH